MKQLTKKQVLEYKRIHEKQYGDMLSDAQARLYATRIVNFALAVLDDNNEIGLFTEDNSCEK